jgi:lipoprotein signal peptidase
MTHNEKYPVRFMTLVGGVLILDILIKSIVVNVFQPTEMSELLGGIFSIGRIQTIRMAGFNFGAVSILFWITLMVQVLILWFTIRVQKRAVHKFYKYATIMIVFGCIGNYVDWILFSGGNFSYVYTEYFYFSLTGSLWSLTTLMITVGWLLLLLSVMIAFKDLKVIFSKAKVSG